MDPVTLTLAAIAGGGKLFQGFFDASSDAQQSEVAASNAALLNKQADIEKMNAPIALARGVEQQGQLRDRLDRVFAAQTNYFTAAGLDPTAPSPLVIAMHSAQQGESDLEAIRAAAALEAAGALTRSANTSQQATAQLFRAAALKDKSLTDIVSGVVGAATAFLAPFKGG